MKNFVLSLLLVIAGSAKAQIDKPPVIYHEAIHFSPLALVQVDYTFMAGYEYRLKSNLALAADLGYIFGSVYLGDLGSQEKASGVIIRPSVRFYHGYRNNFYFQPQVFYKRVTHHLQTWLGVECTDGIGAYSELKEFKYRRNIWGVNATVGRIIPLDKRNKAFIDFYLGLGVKYKKSNVVKQPCSCYQTSSILLTSNDPDNGFFPSMPGGLKFVFTIW
jgi:hypothetical protein